MTFPFSLTEMCLLALTLYLLFSRSQSPKSPPPPATLPEDMTHAMLSVAQSASAVARAAHDSMGSKQDALVATMTSIAESASSVTRSAREAMNTEQSLTTMSDSLTKLTEIVDRMDRTLANVMSVVYREKLRSAGIAVGSQVGEREDEASKDRDLARDLARKAREEVEKLSLRDSEPDGLMDEPKPAGERQPTDKAAESYAHT